MAVLFLFFFFVFFVANARQSKQGLCGVKSQWQSELGVENEVKIDNVLKL